MRTLGKMLPAPLVLMTLALLGAALIAPDARAQYFRRPESTINPNIMLIDEKAVLGAKISPETVLIDAAGRELTWGSLTGKPVILVLSYYTCDGSCSIVNGTLADLLKSATAVTPGTDFRVVTLSFDRHDNAKTTEAFKAHLGLTGALADNWLLATFKSEEALKRETERIGFKFFWSPEDRIFLHPGAFLFFGPDGRLVRILYQDAITTRDVELAVLDAREGKFRPTELVKFALSLCYSYSYHDGRYVMSIPILVGIGALVVGLTTLFGSMAYYKSTKRTQSPRGKDYAQAA